MTNPRTIKPCDRKPSQLVMRMVEVRSDTADDENKSIEVVVATETPVQRYDETSDTVYDEVLLMSGIELRGQRARLPIVDSHNRSTVRNVLGSIRDLKAENGRFVGVASFARDRDSQDAYQKLVDGHLTDFSITATPMESQQVREGETLRIGETEFTGPSDIITRWMPTDASLVAVGADENSTVRELLRAYEIPHVQPTGEIMDEELLKQLRGMGMPEDIESADGALAWAAKRMEATDEETVENMEEEIENMDDEQVRESHEEETERSLDRNEIARGLIKRNKEIRALGRKAKIERSVIDSLCDDPDITLDSVREKVLERMISNSKPLGATTNGDGIRVVKDGYESTQEAMRDGLVLRAFGGLGSKPDFGDKGPARGHENFQKKPLLRLAEDVLRASGIETGRLSQKDIAEVALGNPSTINRLVYNRVISRDNAYHTTGAFPNLLLDAANKTLLAGYDEAPYTWNVWARQGQSVSDMKDIHRIRFSESPDPEMVPEGKEYKEKTMADAKESYAVEKYGAIFSVTWETIVNDDMDAISRIPQLHGAACRRKQNKVVYAVLTANAAMADGTALFAAGHSNLAGSGSAISSTSLNTAFVAMMTQKGLKDEIIGSAIPKFLIVPPSASQTAYQYTRSIGDPGVGGDTTGHGNVHNPYGPGGDRNLTVVVEPELEANSTTAWYLAANNSLIDTVELTFLAGEESPVLENEWDFKTDTYKHKVRQTFAAKAIDWRGLYKNAGA